MDSDSDSEDKHPRRRDTSELIDRQKKRKHSPESQKHKGRYSPKSHRDRSESSSERENWKNKQRYKRESDSDSEKVGRDRRKRSRTKEHEGRHESPKDPKQQDDKYDRKSLPEGEVDKNVKLSEDTQKNTVNKTGVVLKKTTESAASEARKRYLERKLAKEKVKLISQQE